MRGLALALAISLLSAPLLADPIVDLQRAEAEIARATTSQGQRGALGRALRAYEAAMTELSQDIERLGQSIRAHDRTIAEETKGVRGLLSALIRLGRISEPRLLVSSDPPIDTLRAMILLDSLSAQARLRIAALNEQRLLRQELQIRQTEALAQLATSRRSLAALRTELVADALARRRARAAELPSIGTDAAILTALSVALAETLPAPTLKIEGLPEPLALPAPGTLLRPFNTPGPTGIRRPGLTIASAPATLVSAPVRGTVRFAGHLDGYGNVVILEPRAEVLLILAGLGSVLVSPGQIAGKDTALGFLPGNVKDHEDFLPTSADASGQLPAKTLYIELRYDHKPVDPARWFRYDR
ncbi:MAG: peptidoglycan DD-metalloendopeptidase family protein [Pseudomonadota bacterium]